MKWKCFAAFWCVVVATVPALAQEKLYPVRDSKETTVLLTSDRTAFVVERAFQHKLTLGFPTDNVAFIPETRPPLVVLWLRIQNVAPRPMQYSIAKFTSTDDQGKTYPAMTPDDVSKLVVGDDSNPSLGTKTLRGISLGRAGSKLTIEQLKEDIERYSLRSGELAPGGVKEGLIYFEAPQRKKFTVSILLGDLWSKPLVF